MNHIEPVNLVHVDDSSTGGKRNEELTSVANAANCDEV